MLLEPSNLQLATEGTCAFCGKTRREVRALVGSPPVATVVICDECLALCCSILAEQAGVTHDAGRNESAADFPTEKLDAILATLAQRPPTKDPHEDRFRCSLCQRPRREVASLVAGPRVFICDGCVGGAVAVVKSRSG